MDNKSTGPVNASKEFLRDVVDISTGKETAHGKDLIEQIARLLSEAERRSSQDYDARKVAVYATAMLHAAVCNNGSGLNDSHAAFVGSLVVSTVQKILPTIDIHLTGLRAGRLPRPKPT